MKLHQSINSEKSGFISKDVEIGNQVKDSEQKARRRAEDGMETGSIEALIILVMKWTRNIFMTSFFQGAWSSKDWTNQQRKESKSEGSELEVVAEKTKMWLYVGR